MEKEIIITSTEDISREYFRKLDRIQAAAGKALQSGRYGKAIRLYIHHAITSAQKKRMDRAIETAAYYIYK